MHSAFFQILGCTSGYTVGLSRPILLYKHINMFSGCVMELKCVLCPFADSAGTRRRGGFEQPPSLFLPESFLVVTPCPGGGEMPSAVVTPLRASADNTISCC